MQKSSHGHRGSFPDFVKTAGHMNLFDPADAIGC
jgi:hypothetical protein